MVPAVDTPRQPRWSVLIQGIVALVLGISLLTYPIGVLVILTVFLGIYWMINGIIVLISLYSDRSDRNWKILVGILGIIAGILVLVYPLYSAILLPTFLAIIIGVDGLIIGAIHIARGFAGAGLGAWVIGIVSIIFGLILIAHPFIATLALIWVLAIIAIIGGILAIAFALWKSV